MKFFVSKKFYEKKPLFQTLKKHLPFLLILFGVVAFHLFEVNVIDPPVTDWVGHDFANNIRDFEGNIVFWFSQNWTPVLVYFFVIMYIAVYPFLLWFSPFYFLKTDDKKPMKALAYGSLFIYIGALPFYLFMPITNVFTYYNVNSALETVFPSISGFFYSTTTQNNCLPSLHTSMTILIAYSISLTGNKKLTYFAYFTMISVIISVIYLSIHWITDVISGAILSVVVIFILKRLLRKEE